MRKGTATKRFSPSPGAQENLFLPGAGVGLAGGRRGPWLEGMDATGRLDDPDKRKKTLLFRFAKAKIFISVRCVGGVDTDRNGKTPTET